MTRSLWKGPFFHPSLLKKTINKTNFKKIKVWSRNSTILKEFVGYQFEIHNGKNFITLKVNEEMIGHKFGEFASTRKIAIHKNKKRK